jgi:diadenosine tetraphosphate (Ap4A) HIT family hydrolase
VTTTPAVPEPSDFVARLPIGEQLTLPADSMLSWDIFPFTGEIRVKPLTPPVLPEPPRNGEEGPDGCHGCERPVEDAIWADEHWRVDPIHEDQLRLPAVVMLMPRGHHDLTDLPPGRAAELGPMIQRVERAVLSLGGIARVHVNRWGDGGAHLHFWLIARPEGMTQLRGSFLPVWEEALPAVPDEERRETQRRIAASLAAGGGKAYAR